MRVLAGFGAEPGSSKAGLFKVPQNPHFMDDLPWGNASSAPHDSQFIFVKAILLPIIRDLLEHYADLF
jgi:hypothetical protein